MYGKKSKNDFSEMNRLMSSACFARGVLCVLRTPDGNPRTPSKPRTPFRPLRKPEPPTNLPPLRRGTSRSAHWQARQHGSRGETKDRIDRHCQRCHHEDKGENPKQPRMYSRNSRSHKSFHSHPFGLPTIHNCPWTVSLYSHLLVSE